MIPKNLTIYEWKDYIVKNQFNFNLETFDKIKPNENNNIRLILINDEIINKIQTENKKNDNIYVPKDLFGKYSLNIIRKTRNNDININFVFETKEIETIVKGNDDSQINLNTIFNENNILINYIFMDLLPLIKL